MHEIVLERLIDPRGSGVGSVAFDDPAMIAAPFARATASAICAIDPANGETCAWYHGVRLYVRALGIDVDKSSGDQQGFFTATLRALAAAGGHSRVLVSGTADYAMPALVIAAFGAESAALELAVLDRCPTPLALTQWYAQRRGVAIRTEAREFLGFTTPEPFDVVCTDSFIAQFPDNRREELVAAWHRALRPGGRLVTTNRLRTSTTAETVRNSTERACAFRDAALAEVARRPDMIRAGGVGAAEIAEAIRIYALRKRTYPVRSKGDIVALFEGNGFAIERLDVIDTNGARPAGRNSGYARIIAIRR